MRLREQMGNLGFEGARVDDLSERRVGRERQKIARNIEGAGAQRALVRVRLHFNGTWSNAGEIFEGPLRNFFVGGEQAGDGFAIETRRRSIALKARSVVTALPEVLIASRALLSVPALLVGYGDSGENGKPFNSQREVRKVGNRTVPILKIEGVKKFFRLLRGNFL